MKTQSPFGQKLKYWRHLRGFSQLSLATEAEVSTRHISFIETGRSRPGKELVLRLANTLEVPPRECNELMQAAGLSPLYNEGKLSEEEMLPYQRIIGHILKNHDPYPAFVLDRWWNVVEANKGTATFFPHLAKPNSNVLEAYLANESSLLINRPEIGWNLLFRAKQDWAQSGQDESLYKMIKRLEDRLADGPPPNDDTFPKFPVITARAKVGDKEISIVGTIMRFDTARDITLDELRIELFYPADKVTEEFFNQ